MPLQRLIQLITGARQREFAQTLFSFLSLFFLLFSYYMMKPLRNSQFLKEFDPNFLPFVFLVVPLLSFAVTKLFNHFYDRMPKYHLLVWTYLTIIGCKLLFALLLPGAGRLIIIIFYFWASVYFLLSLAILWAVINAIFSAKQAERCYGFVMVGGTIGNIAGAEISAQLARSAFKDWAPVVAALAMGLALILILLAVKFRFQDAEQMPSPEIEKPADNSGRLAKFFEDFRKLFHIRYVRGLAIMVFSLALFNTVLDFQSQKVLDDQLARQQYMRTFQALNRELNHGQPELNQKGFEFIYGLKQENPKRQQQVIAEFLKQQAVPFTQTEMAQQYQEYKDKLEGQVRKLFSNIYKYQGILGVFLLLVVTRFLFRFVGIRFAVAILPIFFILAGMVLFLPVDLLVLELILVIGGALNYSLNNATKELLYTTTSEETKFKHKPLIEGPVMRLGDVSASLLKLFIGFGVVKLLSLTEWQGDWLYMGCSLLFVIFWLRAIWYTGRMYDQVKSR